MVDIFSERLDSYEENHCWQYDIRLKNLKDDVTQLEKELGYHVDYTKLSVSDFDFKQIITEEEKRDAIDFIKRHEWLGTITQYTTHWFGAYYKGILAGVINFSMPNAFSKILGDNTKELERLISRGACISWSPKCLASSLLMWSIKYMVKNTRYRLFTAYSDPTAKEIGTIYQACNFYYLGQKSGTTTRYINPYTGKIVSDRFFRTRSAYKKYAKELGIEWDKSWNSPQSMLWDNMPKEIEIKLKDFSKKKQLSSEKVIVPAKHKYAYVLGENKKETKELKKIFLERNKIYEYPKER